MENLTNNDAFSLIMAHDFNKSVEDNRLFKIRCFLFLKRILNRCTPESDLYNSIFIKLFEIANSPDQGYSCFRLWHSRQRACRLFGLLTQSLLAIDRGIIWCMSTAFAPHSSHFIKSTTDKFLLLRQIFMCFCILFNHSCNTNYY